jgi:hypothetical protein
MIRYDLLCDSDHEFDGWYRDSETFDKLLKANQVQCPSCGSTKVRKALMTPSLGQKQNQKTVQTKSEIQKSLVTAAREIRREVEKNADYVGKEFAEEARKIHYKEAEGRGIYGETTVEDAKSLSEEGIEIHPLPILPEDQN